MKEILTINIGQAGIRIGDVAWQKLIQQHQIAENGSKISKDSSYNDHSVFYETSNGNLVPRNIFVDTGPQSNDQIKRSKLRNLYNPSSYINDKQDTGNNYIRGNLTIGKQIIDQTLDEVRKRLQLCESIEGVIVNAALAGGTGSGFTNLLLGRLQHQYTLKKKPITINLVCPSPHLSDTIVQPYNVILGLGNLCEIDSQKLVNCFDNQKMYQICEKNGIEDPGYYQINQLIAQSMNLLSHNFRLSSSIHNMTELHSNLVPFKKICFMQPNINKKKIQQGGKRGFLQALWSDQNSLSSYGLKGLNYQKFTFSMSTILRGSILSFDAVTAFQHHKQTLNWIPWCKTGFKLFANSFDSNVSCNFVEGLNLSNNNNMLDLLKYHHQKYDSLFTRRAFVHWYVGEGIEDEDFSCHREYTSTLQKDYEQSSVLQDLGEGDQ